MIRYQDRCPTALSRNAQAVILLVCGFVQKKEQKQLSQNIARCVLAALKMGVVCMFVVDMRSHILTGLCVCELMCMPTKKFMTGKKCILHEAVYRRLGHIAAQINHIAAQLTLICLKTSLCCLFICQISCSSNITRSVAFQSDPLLNKDLPDAKMLCCYASASASSHISSG